MIAGCSFLSLSLCSPCLCIVLFWFPVISVQELYTLMFSLDWVTIKAKIMGSAHLINDYVEYGSILDTEVTMY